MKKYKGFIIGGLVGASLMFSAQSFAAIGDKAEAIFSQFNFVINGQAKTLDESPVVINGNSYLPVRSISNALGYDVTYKADSRTIELNNGVGGTSTSAKPQAQEVKPQAQANVPNSTQPKSNDAPVTLKMGETYENGIVRIRFYDLVKTPATDNEKNENKYIDRGTFKVSVELIDKDAPDPSYVRIDQKLNVFNTYTNKNESNMNGMLLRPFSSNKVNIYDYNFVDHESSVYKSITNSILEYGVKDVTWILE